MTMVKLIDFWFAKVEEKEFKEFGDYQGSGIDV